MPDRDRAAERAGTEREIDALYQRPLAEFTAARNELARALAKSGARDESARVKALAKPTVTPWAVNQVYWQARSIWDRLMTAGEALRLAQVAALEQPGRTDVQVQRTRERVREATSAHRDALQDAVHQAVRAAAAAGAHLAADQAARMLESLSLAIEPASPPGRFTEVIGPAGFEALAGVTPGASPLAFLAVAARPAAAAPGAPARPARHDQPGPAGGSGRSRKSGAAPAAHVQAPDAATAAREHAARLQAATDALSRARAAEREAAAVEARARDSVADAELAVRQAQRALEDAGRAHRRAADERAAAEAHLVALRESR